MIQIKPLDPKFPIQEQFGQDETGPLVLLNVFLLDAADEPAFMAAWEKDASYMRRSPGYISAQLHRAVGPSPCYFNQEVWQSLEAFRNAFSDPAFKAALADYPSSAVTSPHLFRRIAVDGICVA